MPTTPASVQPEALTDPKAEAALIEKAALRVGMKSLMNHGAASCVYTDGCNGVSQEHIIAFAREIAVHCVAAMSDHPVAAGSEAGLMAAFDTAVAAEILRVSHLPYDSHEICKHFAAQVRARLAPALSDVEGSGWISVDERLPACDGATMFIGENAAGYIACFNALTDVGYCFHNTAESSICVMSGLRMWKRVDRPLPAPPAAKGAV